MKRVFTLLLAVLLTAACAVTALAEPYDTSYYRVNDYCELLEEEEVETLDEKACEALVDLKFDFPICLVELEGEQDIEDFAEWFYEGFGYGDEHDGILLTIDFSQYEYILTPVGRGELIFDDETLDKLDEATLEALTDEDKTWAESLDAYLDAAIAIVAASDIAPSAGTETPPDTTTPSVGGGAPTKTQENGGTAAAPSVGAQAPQSAPGMPSWYPADVHAFQDFHDASAPRVVDNANIFTPAEEAVMLEKIKSIQALGIDLVVFTDNSSYGLERRVYAADFHQFNGYGFGDDYNGSCLFICMEPGNRGFETVWTGDCSKFYTSKNTDWLDDNLYDYMVDGEYGDGVINYLDNVKTLYTKGSAPKSMFMPVVVGLIVGVIAGLVVLAILKSGMQTVEEATRAHNYLVRGSFRLTDSRDIYLYSTVTRTKIEKSKSSGGGFSSSGGRSYGGSGRSF